MTPKTTWDCSVSKTTTNNMISFLFFLFRYFIYRGKTTITAAKNRKHLNLHKLRFPGSYKKNCTASPAALYHCQSISNNSFFKTITKTCQTPLSKFNAIFWERIEILAAASRLVQSHGLRYMWNHVERPLNQLFCTQKKSFRRGFVNCNHQHINFFSRLIC